MPRSSTSPTGALNYSTLMRTMTLSLSPARAISTRLSRPWTPRSSSSSPRTKMRCVPLSIRPRLHRSTRNCLRRRTPTRLKTSVRRASRWAAPTVCSSHRFSGPTAHCSLMLTLAVDLEASSILRSIFKKKLRCYSIKWKFLPYRLISLSMSRLKWAAGSHSIASKSTEARRLVDRDRRLCRSQCMSVRLVTTPWFLRSPQLILSKWSIRFHRVPLPWLQVLPIRATP